MDMCLYSYIISSGDYFDYYFDGYLL